MIRRFIRMGIGRGGASYQPTPWYQGMILAYQPVGAVSRADSYINIANPGTYDATPSGEFGGWSAALGWFFDSVLARRLNTGWTPANTQNLSAIFYLDSPIGGVDKNRVVFGANNFRMGTYTGNMVVANGGVLDAGAPQTGVYAIAGNTAYLNGVSIGTIPAGTYTNAHPVFIGQLNSSGSGVYPYDGYIRACGFYNGVLSADDVLDRTTKMLALP